ncbi:MAG: tRNA 2-thiocytidine(32) synthetase TtcA [Clostridium sp.]|nr:tRNA 2-thiocytidine(32) synthetase TtcA [Clostridium sp.]
MLNIRKLLGQIRRAIEDYDMIQDGDRVAVGVSGGKDSLALLVALRQIKNFLPRKFEIEAVTLTMGIGEFDPAPIKELCRKIDVNYTIEETLIGKIVFEAREEKNPCSLCANLRRDALNNAAKRLNCNKVALAHHRDDVIETLLLSTFYEGRLHTFSPVTYLDRKDLYVIRPLIYTEEKLVKEFIKGNNITTVPNPCQMNGKSRRQYIKDLLTNLKEVNCEIKNNIFGAIKRSGIDRW